MSGNDNPEWDRLVEAYGADVTDLARKLAEWMVLQAGESQDADAMLVEIASLDHDEDEGPWQELTPEQARERLVDEAAIDVVYYFDGYFDHLTAMAEEVKVDRARRKVVDVVDTL